MPLPAPTPTPVPVPVSVSVGILRALGVLRDASSAPRGGWCTIGNMDTAATGTTAIPHLDLLDDLLRRVDNERVVTQPGLVEYGNWEILDRWVVRGTAVDHWHGERGHGDWTGTTFEQPEDAARSIATSAAGQLRARNGLSRAHWLLDRAEELPAGFTLATTYGQTVLDWELGGTLHRAWFGAPGFVAPAVAFATVARVPVDEIEQCALQEDSRGAFAEASSKAS